MEEEIYKIEHKDAFAVMTLMLDMILVDENEKLKKAYADLIAGGTKCIILDMANTTYISSLVIASLVYMQKMARDAGGNMVICGVNKKVREIFEVTNLDKVFDITGNLEEACAKLHST